MTRDLFDVGDLLMLLFWGPRQVYVVDVQPGELDFLGAQPF